jgi:hypothetical protein
LANSPWLTPFQPESAGANQMEAKGWWDTPNQVEGAETNLKSSIHHRNIVYD